MKNAFIAIGVVALAVFGVGRLRDRHAVEAPADSEAVGGPSARGFLPVALSSMPRDKVVVIAPDRCTRAAGRRADELTGELGRMGIPCERTARVGAKFDHPVGRDVVDRLNSVMSGAMPVVYIRGRAKNDPSTADVVAEFRGD